MSEPAKNQHFVPRLYLKGFSDPDAPPHYDPYVWTWTRDTLKWEKIGVVHACAKLYYNSFRDREGKLNHAFDDYLTKLENASAALRKIIKSELLTEREREQLSIFMALQMVRVPAFRDSVEAFLQKVLADLAKINYQQFARDPSKLEKLKAEMLREGIDVSAARPEDFDPKTFRVAVEKAFVLDLAFEHVHKIAQVIFDMGWVVIHTKDPVIITSDNPVSLYNSENPDDHIVGLLTEHATVHFPISRTAVLSASLDYDKQSFNESSTLDDKMVMALNLRTMLGKPSTLIASQPVFPGSELLRKNDSGETKT